MINSEYAGTPRDGQSAGIAGLNSDALRDYQGTSMMDGGIVRPVDIIEEETTEIGRNDLSTLIDKGSNNVTTRHNVSATDWAWLAGFIDGDGWITCAVWERILNGIPSITIASRVGASQKDREILDYITQTFMLGRVYSKKEKSNGLTTSLQHMWIACRLSEIKAICENILPYVVLKKQQCLAMLEITKIRIENHSAMPNRVDNRRFPVADTLKCAELGLSLNPNSTNGRNSQHNNAKRHWSYWQKRIPEVYREAENIINSRRLRA